METIKDFFDEHWKKLAIAGGAVLVLFVAGRAIISSQETTSPPPTEPTPVPAKKDDPSRNTGWFGLFPGETAEIVSNANLTSETDPDINKFDNRLSVSDECVQFVEVNNDNQKGRATRMNLNDSDAPKIMQAMEGSTPIYVVERTTQPDITYYCLQPTQ